MLDTRRGIGIVEETYLPGNSVSLVARQHGIASNQLCIWSQLMARGLTAVIAGWGDVPASDYRVLEAQARELQQLFSKKRMENEIMREARRRHPLSDR